MSDFDDLRELLEATKAFSRAPADEIRRELLKRPNSARQFETDLEMAQRHVHEAESIVKRQHDVVVGLRARGIRSTIAESLLARFEDALAHHRAWLRQIKGSHKTDH